MPLPPTFTFSQSALQSFSNCPRQFWLTWLQRLPWPAVAVAPALDHERRMRLGRHFHRLVERAELGVADPVQPLASLEPPLRDWYEAWLSHKPTGLPDDVRAVECTLSTPVDLGAAGRVRLIARYDLIAAQRRGRAVIVDWKAGERPATQAELLLRQQSLIYPFVLVEASPGLAWGPLSPDQVEMVYWFTSAPTTPVRLAYSAAQHEANRRRLVHLLADIVTREKEEEFPLIPDSPENRRRHCSFCIYRSRCDRGDAGALSDFDAAESLEAGDFAILPTLESVDELAF